MGWALYSSAVPNIAFRSGATTTIQAFYESGEGKRKFEERKLEQEKK